MSADFWLGMVCGFFGFTLTMAALLRTSRRYVPESTQRTIDLLAERNALDAEKIAAMKIIAATIKGVNDER